MDRYLCIHGHFYQPPRENPWLEAIEIQDSAYPYHDWNERINAECYAPNSASRVIDNKSRILDIMSNYSRISFNFGPTLLSWAEVNDPSVYEAILEADRQSMEWRSGHGNALAQVYNHIIMPLANRRDKETQISWGIKDFEHRFRRFPEGMWLSETAVDTETLDMLAVRGIRFTILAPRQAFRVRKIGTGKWKDVSGGRIDPTRAYLCKLPSGRAINLFFYDGPLSQAVAFEKLLNRGEDFANRLLTGFSDARDWPQLLTIGTDGETYGHHHRFGDMALAYALHYVESNGLARLTNYGEYLEKHPPTHEVQIYDNSSWSCVHGVERWRSDCGCNTGGRPGWNQQWRGPLRASLDWLRDQLIIQYEQKCSEYLRDPWAARHEYIEVILDRSKENISAFVNRHANRLLQESEILVVLKLLEMQRHAMLMYTSCGWFFDELSGIETVQVIQYAGRTLQLYDYVTGDSSLEDGFLDKLAEAKSNLPERRDGAHIYESYVKPAMIDLTKVGIHYAVSSLFEDYADRIKIYCYEVVSEDYRKVEAGHSRLALGRITVTSEITWKTEQISFCVLHFGSHALNGGARPFKGDEAYQSMKQEILDAFHKGDFAGIVRLMDNHFGMHNYSLRDLFRDEQRKILMLDISSTLDDFQNTYRSMYDNNRILMGYLQETCMPVPHAFQTAAEFILNFDIEKAFTGDEVNEEKIRNLIDEIKIWNVVLDEVRLEFAIRRKLEKRMNHLHENPADLDHLLVVLKMLRLLEILPLEINYWHAQNIYFRIAKSIYSEYDMKSRSGDEKAVRWTDAFRSIGDILFFNIPHLFPEV